MHEEPGCLGGRYAVLLLDGNNYRIGVCDWREITMESKVKMSALPRYACHVCYLNTRRLMEIRRKTKI
jgi:hypothetical protein